ncbi:Thp1 protein [Saccharomycopsis crataegensis]|uniref:Thp1 protein n=1 Tax=Saccharomycopsis crataegensis TaxID=43959 RepID=A0AAV5QHC4_9ASCO|nr:Thp1 protein [Saccharomycopsis crataegensis]
MTMSHGVLQDYLNQVKQLVSQNKSIAKVMSINVGMNPQMIANLQNELNSNQVNIRNTLENFFLFKDGKQKSERFAFTQLVETYLVFIRDFNPYSIVESIDLILNYLNSLIVVFNNYDDMSNSLIGCLMSDLDFGYKVCKIVDKVLWQQGINRNYPILTKLSIYLSKLFNDCKKNQTRNPIKKSILLKISNYMLMIYFVIDQPLNCATIFITNRHNFKTLRGSDFGKADVIKYRYYLGKFLILNDLYRPALIQFTYCYSKYPITHMRSQNFENILELLIVMLLSNGYHPQSQLIMKFQNPKLRNLYSSLVYAVKSGNVKEVNRIIDTSMDYLRHKGLYNLLLRNLTILTYRNLFYQTFKILNNGNVIENYTATLQYSSFLVGLKVSEDSYASKTVEEQLQHVEEILVSLIDKKWIKGVIFPGSSRIALSKKGNAFSPPLTNVNPRNEYDWLDK